MLQYVAEPCWHSVIDYLILFIRVLGDGDVDW